MNRGGNLQKLTKCMLFLFVLLFEISNVVAIFAFWFLKELNVNLMYVKYIHAVYCMYFCQKKNLLEKVSLFQEIPSR